MLLYILCSLSSWLCPLPPPLPAVPIAAPLPVAPVVAPPVAEGEDGPHWGLGQIWTGVTEHDTGFCPGYGMPSPSQGSGQANSGARPSLSWPVPGGTLHEGRGFRVGHPGIDIDAAEGSVVLAAAGGVVVWAGWSTWGFGLMVAISHGGGWWSLYGHLSAVTVGCGDWVGSGSPIGLVGKTGAATFFHCHFELRRGAWSWRPF